MDEHPMYGAAAAGGRYGAPVAPLLFPSLMFRRPLGTPDPVEMRAGDPDFDGSATAGNAGLPPIEPLRDYSVLNGGAEVELYRYARHGEQVSMQSRYADIREKEGRKGPMVLVVVESEYRTLAAELLLRVKRTYIWSRA
jgi:hydroxyacyl-ACP dehydratase HTD2-like protein with hotdog domain